MCPLRSNQNKKSIHKSYDESPLMLNMKQLSALLSISDTSIYELAIYAYLLRIKHRRIWQCMVSYSTIADKPGISVNTTAKDIELLEEHDLISAERTDVITWDRRKRNDSLRHTIL